MKKAERELTRLLRWRTAEIKAAEKAAEARAAAEKEKDAGKWKVEARAGM